MSQTVEIIVEPNIIEVNVSEGVAWDNINNKPAVIAAGSTIQEALEQIGLENVNAEITSLQEVTTILNEDVTDIKAEQITQNDAIELRATTEYVNDEIGSVVEYVNQGDKTNADAITVENQRAITSEQNISNNLATETTNRIAGDQTNANAIIAETNRATTAEALKADKVNLPPTPSNVLEVNDILRRGNIISNIIDQYTGEPITATKATGTPTVDNIIYFQIGSEIFKRNFTVLNVAWFSASSTKTANENSTILTASFSSISSIGVVLVPKGIIFNYDTFVYPNGITILDYQRNCIISNKTQIGGAKVSGGSGANIQLIRGAEQNQRASIYVMPRGVSSDNVASAFKLFTDDFELEQEKKLLDPSYTLQYRDFGIYIEKSIGVTGAGTAMVNAKCQGNWYGIYPEIGLSIQDGNVIPLRALYHDYTIPNIKVNGAWEANKSIALGEKYIVFPGYYYECTVAGTTGTTAPSHTTGSATDGTVTWLFLQKVASGGTGFQGVIIIGSKTAIPIKNMVDLALQLENHSAVANGKALHFLNNSRTSVGYFECQLNTSDFYFKRMLAGVLQGGNIRFGGNLIRSSFLQINDLALISKEITKTSLATTMSVGMLNTIVFNDASATNFTGFTDGLPAQTLTLRFSNANTTLKYGVNFVLSSGSDYTPYANEVLTFYSTNGVSWYQKNGCKTIIDTTSTAYTKSSLNTAYPNAKVGVTIVQDSGGFTFIKKDNSSTGNWSKIASSQLA